VLAIGLAFALLAPGVAPSDTGPCPPQTSDAARDEAQLLLKAGQEAMDSGRFEEGEQALRDAVRIDPASPFGHYAVGAALLERRPREAVLAFTRCREVLRCLREDDPETRERFRAQIDLQMQTVREAILEMERERLKKSAIPGQELADGTKATLGQSAPTLLALELRMADLQRLRQHPEQEPPTLAVAMGHALLLAGQTVEAEREFRLALTTDPGYGDAHNNLAVLCMLQGRIEEAEREMKAAEKAGIKIPKRLKDEMKARRKAEAAQAPERR
jgi:Tfp pilus assembly protein PilF